MSEPYITESRDWPYGMSRDWNPVMESLQDKVAESIVKMTAAHEKVSLSMQQVDDIVRRINQQRTRNGNAPWESLTARITAPPATMCQRVV